MARFNITLPDYIVEKLDEEAKRLDVAHSTLNAHLKRVEKLIAEHEAEVQQVRDAYEEQVQQIKADSAARTQHVEEELQLLETLTLQPPAAEPEPQSTAEPEPQPTITLPDYIAEKLDEEAKRLDAVHFTLNAHLKRVEKLIAEHEAEVQQVRDAYEEQVQQIKADSAARTQHVEEELQRVETLTLQPPTAEPEPQPTAEPEPQPTAEPEPQPTPEPEPQPTPEPEPQPTPEPEPQPTAGPEPQPTAGLSPFVLPVSDTDLRPPHPIKKLEDLGPIIDHRPHVDFQLPPLEPSPKVAVAKDTDVRSMEEPLRVIGKDDRIVLESGLFKSHAPREKQA